MNPIQASLPSITPPGLSMELGPELTASAEALKGGKGKEQIEKMASDFESVFVSLMLKEMRNTLDSGEGGLFGGEGSDTFGGMFDLFMGQHLSESSPLGIADAIKGFMNNVPLEYDQKPQTSQIDEAG